MGTFALRQTKPSKGPDMPSWTITITAPTGSFDASLHVTDVDGVPSGEMSGKNGTGPMLDLKLDAETISWATKVERPMPMKLKFQGTHDGDVITGTVKFGLFASGTFSGTRAA